MPFKDIPPGIPSTRQVAVELVTVDQLASAVAAAVDAHSKGKDAKAAAQAAIDSA